MRLEECVLIRVSQVSEAVVDLEQRGVTSNDDRLVSLGICFGTKGGRRPNDPERRGKGRILRVRPSVIEGLDRYIKKIRPFAVRRFRERWPNRPLPSQLFLSEVSGEPITTAALYKAWHQCQTLPFEGWSPHLGRHTWACLMLLSHVERERQLLAKIATAGAAPTSWAMQLAVDYINVVLRPAMGHISERTTEGYLGWLDASISTGDPRRTWSDFLEGDLE